MRSLSRMKQVRASDSGSGRSRPWLPAAKQAPGSKTRRSISSRCSRTVTAIASLHFICMQKESLYPIHTTRRADFLLFFIEIPAYLPINIKIHKLS